MTVGYNHNMSLNDIYETVANISNSLYNLQKKQILSQDSYLEMKPLVDKLYSVIGLTILFERKSNES